jgi:hypothetical protein
MADIAGVAVGSVIPLPRNNVGPRLVKGITAWFTDVLAGARTRARASRPARQAERRYYHPRRETYLENAAMSRAMERL